MSYKNREVQPELFCKTQKKQKQNLLNKNIFCSPYKSAITVSLDTLIVVIIGVLMINLSSFVLGIEKGKMVAQKQKSEIMTVQPTGNAAVPSKQKKQVSVPALDTKEKKVKIKPVEEKQVVKNIGNPATGYIIQLVTYSSNTYANKEVRRLKSQGLDGNVLKSGEYYVVYSGTFNSKTKANEKLASFKKRYKDCFVRFLKKS